MAEWEKRVRSSIKEASKLKHPILIDTLPAFLDNIAEAVSDTYPRTDAIDSTSLASEHGGERARLTSYDPQALINEYQILRWTIFDTLHQNGVQLSHEETLAINASLDGGIREAVNAFALIHSAMREQFVAALTHDLLGPLYTAKLATQLILASVDPGKMVSYVTKVDESLDRMSEMIHQLLDSMAFQRGQRLTLELSNFDILELVTEMRSDINPEHAERIQVVGGSIIGWWDRNALRRALENLIGNAVKYGDSSKSIRVKFNEVHERLVLSVHNKGLPIPPEEQEDIFQIFRRAQSAKEGKKAGWGIGLPFVRGVAESHGGSIAIDSTAERGTTFTIDIPVDSRPFQDTPISEQPSLF